MISTFFHHQKQKFFRNPRWKSGIMMKIGGGLAKDIACIASAAALVVSCVHGNALTAGAAVAGISITCR